MMCFQVCRDLILLTKPSLIENSRAISFLDFLDSLMARTVSSLTVALGCDSPEKRGGGFPPHLLLPRLFPSLSRMLSSCVPQDKCAGLQQEGLSQECITTRPSGILPLVKVYTILCANFLPVLASMLNKPYPLLFLVANQGQHSSASVTNTFAHNLFSSVSLFPTINTLWTTKAPMSTYKGGYFG